jgi:hypothetical protein
MQEEEGVSLIKDLSPSEGGKPARLRFYKGKDFPEIFIVVKKGEYISLDEYIRLIRLNSR